VLRQRLIVATALIAVAGCGGGAQRRAAADAPPAPSCPPAGSSEVEGGHLRLPAAAKPGATPLIVVVVPGGRGDRGDRLGVGAAATKQGFAVLYPTSGDTFWALNHEQGDTDVDAVKALLDRTLATGCIDAGRIAVTGVSNGAGFAARLACELPDRFAAVVPVAAGSRARRARAPRSSTSTGRPTPSSPTTARSRIAPGRSRATPRAGRAATAATPGRRRRRHAGSSRACATAAATTGCASSACACRAPTTGGPAPARRSLITTRRASAPRASCCASWPPRSGPDERRRARKSARPMVRRE
jgi:poly(3-hydroxybutyrate) depolymerase